jgi:hypothetical protein
MRGQDTSHTTSTSVDTFRAWNFVLTDFGGYATFQAAFEQYRIDEIEVWLVPACGIPTPAAQENGTFIVAVDTDDSATPGSYTALQSFDSAVDGMLYEPRYLRFKPRFATAAYSGAFTSYESSGGWLDCDSNTVQHYGVKLAASTSSYATPIKILFRARVSFRYPKA